MSDQTEIAELLQKCRQGNSAALGRLVDLYSARCYGYFYRLTGSRDSSEELLSELYIRLVEKISSFEGGSFEKWLFTIASNLFRDRLRKQYRQKRLLEEKPVCWNWKTARREAPMARYQIVSSKA